MQPRNQLRLQRPGQQTAVLLPRTVKHLRPGLRARAILVHVDREKEPRLARRIHAVLQIAPLALRALLRQRRVRIAGQDHLRARGL